MKICITGKPCSGKSLAVEYIKKAGYNTFVVDEYVHEIYKKGNIGYKVIKKSFGDNFINNKEVDRKALGAAVFGNKKNLKKLNNLMNPIIKKAIKNLDKKQDWFIELATYIYYPEVFNDIFDKIILVFNNQNWKNDYQKQKFNYLKKIPTFFVDNQKNKNVSILNIDKIGNNKADLNVDIFVNNSQSKIILKKTILKVCKNLTQHIIK